MSGLIPSSSTRGVGMSRRVARTIETAIVLLSVAALLLLFQPFSLGLYSVGAGLVVVAGLVFNLVPLCQPGRSLGSLLRAAVIIAASFVVVTTLALGSAELYSVYLHAQALESP